MENDSTNDRRSVDPRDQPSLLGRKRATPSSPSSKDNEEDTDMDWMLIPPPSADTLSLNDHSHNGKDDDDDNDCEKVEDEDNAIAGFYWQSSIQTETGGNWGQAVQAAASFNQQMLWERRLRGPFYKDIHTNSVQVVDSFFVNNLETPSPSYLVSPPSSSFCFSPFFLTIERQWPTTERTTKSPKKIHQRASGP